MLDCWAVRQRMIFFVDDVSSSDDIIYKGEHTPKKRRPWIVVSNDMNNMNSAQISMVPIYTQTEVRLPTHVHFISESGREQVARCEGVMSIPKHMIDTRGYLGTVSDNIFNQIQKALAIQFGITEYVKPCNMESAIKTLIQSMDVENIIANKLKELLILGLNTSITPTHYTMETSNIPVNSPVSTEKTTGDSGTIETVETTKTNSTHIKNSTKEPTTKRKKYGPRGQNMTIEECIQFVKDSETLTDPELYMKWKDFGVKESHSLILKKVWSIKYRLSKENVTVK